MIMSAVRLSISIFCASCAMSASKRGPQPPIEHREHNANWCMPRFEADGGITREEDVEDRNDRCCAAERDFFCGGGWEAVGTLKICSKQDTQITLLEYKCYPDEREFPLGVVIAIMVAVGCCFVAVSTARFRFVKYQAPPIPEGEALFTERESKVLTRSKTSDGSGGSDSLTGFVARISGSKPRSSQSSDTGSVDLPRLSLQQADAPTKGKAVGKFQEEATASQPIEVADPEQESVTEI